MERYVIFSAKFRISTRKNAEILPGDSGVYAVLLLEALYGDRQRGGARRRPEGGHIGIPHVGQKSNNENIG